MNKWIDFKELRSRLKFGELLQFYGVKLEPRGAQLYGLCPLPKHQVKKHAPSFSVNEERGIFQCFGCSAKGNVLDFAGLMEGVDVGDGSAMRKVAEKLNEEFAPSTGKRVPKAVSKPVAAKITPSPELPLVVNEPLDFELKGLDPTDPYLLNRGFLPETIAHFGLGVAARGSLKGRLAIPLHNPDGKLIGYAGRLVDDSQITADNPRYLFPEKREREGVVRDFKKSEILYNDFRVQKPVSDLIVVEGFMNVWWLHQNGFNQPVGLLEPDCSERQGQLLVSLLAPTGRLWILPGGDEIGERLAHSVFKRVGFERFCRWISLPAGQHPTDLGEAELLRWLRP